MCQVIKCNNNFCFSNPLQTAMWWVLHLTTLLMILKREMSNLSTSSYCISVLLHNSFNGIIFTVLPGELRPPCTDVFCFKFSSSEHVPGATLFSLPSTSPVEGPSDKNCDAKVSGETNDKMQQAIIRAF